MMTIKVIQHLIDGVQVTEKGAPKTFLFSGDNVQYKQCFFDNKEMFFAHYERETSGLQGHVIGVPDPLWEAKVIPGGSFLFVLYNADGENRTFLVIQNSTTYVMQGHQTVDTLYSEKYMM